MIGKKERFNFREIHQKILVLGDDPKNVAIVSKDFPYKPGDNALLLYGYIDHETGLSFEVLCIAKLIPGQALELREGMPKISVKLRYDAINGTLYNTDDSLMHMRYLQKIKMINDNYRAPEVAEKMRSIQSLDPSRHPQYPDDIIVWFLKNGEDSEGIWCRIHGHNDRYLTAILLDEPWRDYGYHQGDPVPFDKVAVNGELKAVAVLD